MSHLRAVTKITLVDPNAVLPQRSDGRRNRQAIVAAAVAALDETGEVSFTEVAARAGMTRATVYRHFPDREALMAEIGRHMAHELLTPVLAEMDTLALPQAWRQLAGLVVVAGVEHRALMGTIGGSVEATARIAVVDEPIEAFLRQRRARGEVTSDLPVDWLASCVRAICLASISHPDEASTEVRVDRLTQTLIALTS